MAQITRSRITPPKREERRIAESHFASLQNKAPRNSTAARNPSGGSFFAYRIQEFVNTERFTGRVEDYERFRLRYPTIVLEVLKHRCGLQSSDLIADVGAGTGMLAELFLENGNPVIAIEPNDDMRIACERLISSWPRLTVEKATAEQTSLDDSTIDMIVVGRAFHWFDHEKTAQEFRRILKPHHWVALVSNSRVRDTSPLSSAYEEILNQHGLDYAANRERYRIDPQIEAFFAGGEIIREEIPGKQPLTLDQLIGQTQSLSVTPRPGHPNFEPMQTALRSFFAQWQQNGVVTIETRCKIICGRFS